MTITEKNTNWKADKQEKNKTEKEMAEVTKMDEKHHSFTKRETNKFERERKKTKTQKEEKEMVKMESKICVEKER